MIVVSSRTYCSHHRQILGLQPRTVIKKNQPKSKPKSDLRSKEAHNALVNILNKHGIPEKSTKRQNGSTGKKVKSECEIKILYNHSSSILIHVIRNTQPTTVVEEEDSSDEFPSEDEENAEEADVESGSEDVVSDLDHDNENDGFIADSLLWHFENEYAGNQESEPLEYAIS